MTIPAVFKFVNWITGTPVPIDNAMTSALTPTIDPDLLAALVSLITTYAPNPFSTGDIKLTYKTVADDGWIIPNDGSIGNTGSGATTRANADCLNLFVLLYTNISDTYCPVSGGRSGNAVNDFNAGKTLTVPKTLGRYLGIYGAGSGLTSRALGENLGAESVTPSTSTMAVHNHGVTDPGPGS